MDSKENINKPNIRELTLKHGLNYPNDEELLMMILGSGIQNVPVNTLARRVKTVVDTSDRDDLIKNLGKIKGMGKSKALSVAAAIEFGKRQSASQGTVIAGPGDLIPYVQNFAIKTKEHFLSVTLDGHHKIIHVHVISVGTLNKTIVSPRDVFSPAITENASAVIVCHNHPSGNVEPSTHDIDTTFGLLEASKILGIPILDHIIIDSRSYFSFKEHCLVFTDKFSFEGSHSDEVFV